MSNNAEKLSSVGKFRGIVHAIITRLDTQFSKLENLLEIMHSDSVMIEARTEKLNNLDSNLKKHHFTIIDLIDKDQEKLEREQAVFDDDENKVTNMIDHLIQFVHKNSAAGCGPAPGLRIWSNLSIKTLLPVVASPTGLEMTRAPMIVDQIRNQTESWQALKVS